VSDWTLEANYNDNRVLRGYNFNETDINYTAASRRNITGLSNSFEGGGSRASLY